MMTMIMILIDTDGDHGNDAVIDDGDDMMMYNQ